MARRRLAAIAVAITLGVAGLVSVGSVAAAATPVLQGTVTDASTGLAISAVNVRVWLVGASAEYATVNTTSQGKYSFATLPAGTYQLQFAKTGNYRPIWWNTHEQRADADTFAITASSAFVANQAMTGDNSISGRVRNSASQPIVGAVVKVYVASTTTVAATTTTASDGTWRVAPLVPGSYTVLAEAPGYISWWYHSAGGSGPGVIALAFNSNPSLDMYLYDAGSTASMGGTVSKGTSSVVIPGVTVQVFPVGTSIAIATATTDVNGWWSQTLPLGDYQLFFSKPGFVAQWVGNKPTQAASTVLTLTTGTAAVGANLSSTQNGTLTGTVTDVSSGAPVAGAVVKIHVLGNATAGRTVNSGANGTWTFSGVGAGSYQVNVSATNYSSQWYANASSQAASTTVTMVNLATVAVPVALAPVPTTGTLAGTLTDTATATPIAGATVQVFPSGSASVLATTTTASNGTWSVPNLNPGSYQAYFTASGYASQWYVNASSQGSSTAVTVSVGATTVASASMTIVTGSITGTLTDSANGLPVTQGYVDLFPVGSTLRTTRLYPNGAGVVAGSAIPPGDYQLQAFATYYGMLWYPSSPTQAGAGTLTVSVGRTTTFAIQLVREPTTATLLGTVKDAFDFAPIEGATVAIYPTGSATSAASATTAADGTWTIVGIAPGSYQISWAASGYLTRWIGGGDTQAGSGSTILGAGSIGHPDASLLKVGSGTLTGSVLGVGTVSIAGGSTVDVYPVGSATPIATRTVPTSGSWSVVGLPAGSYNVRSSAPGYVTEWYQDAATQAAANSVDVAVGATTEILVFLAEVPQVGTVTGTVTDAGTSAALSGAAVELHAAGSSAVLATTTTAANGTWTFPNVASGSYQLRFAANLHVPEWYSDSAGQAGATAVVVTPGGTSTVDVALDHVPTGTVSGTITDTTGTKLLAQVSVRFHAVGGNDYLSFTTNPDGQYTATLDPGTYQIEIVRPQYFTEWYDDAATQATSTTITVLSNGTLTVNAALTVIPTVGDLTGTVTDSNTGAPLSGAIVQVYPTGSTTLSASATSSASGGWIVPHLLPGGYQVFVTAGNYVSQWYVTANAQAGATSIEVTAGVTSAANVALTHVTSMSGTVTDGATGAVVAGAAVRLYTARSITSTVVGSAVTDAAGHYSIVGIAPGTYYPYAGKSGAYYSAFAASPLVVTAGTTAAVNFALQAGAAGSGTVTGPNGPVAAATVRLWLGGTQTSTRVETDAAGRYTLAGLTAGTYTVQVIAYGYVTASSSPFTVVSNNATVPSPDVMLAAAPSTTGLTGTVTNAVGGAPISGANVRIWLVGCLCGTAAVTSTTTAANGTWTIASLPAGTYNVQFTKSGSTGGYFPSSITVTAGPSRGTLATQWTTTNGTIAGTYTPGT